TRRRRAMRTSMPAMRAGPRSCCTPTARARPEMAGELSGRRVAILATDGVERVELEQPRQALDGAGAQTTLLSIKTGEIAARKFDLEDAGTFTVDGQVYDATTDEFDALLLPGG